MPHIFPFPKAALQTLCRRLVLFFPLFLLLSYIIHIIILVGIMLKWAGSEDQVGKRWEKKMKEQKKNKGQKGQGETLKGNKRGIVRQGNVDDEANISTCCVSKCCICNKIQNIKPERQNRERYTSKHVILLCVQVGGKLQQCSPIRAPGGQIMTEETPDLRPHIRMMCVHPRRRRPWWSLHSQEQQCQGTGSSRQTSLKRDKYGSA